MTTVHAEVAAARARLRHAGFDTDAAGTDAEVLARAALGWDLATYVARGRSAPPAAFRDRYRSMLERRTRREPVSLIIGRREFWGLDFEVTPDVLTPRPETELVVEEALRALDRQRTLSPRLIDVGSGSGCLAVAIARERPHVRITATDVSLRALRVARRNARRHGVAKRIAWVATSLLDGVGTRPDVIVANLPYVADDDFPRLPPDVRDFEPQVALLGGGDGLDAIRRLLAAAGRQLRIRGALIIEFGFGQAGAIRAAVASVPGLALVHIRCDLGGIQRVAVIERQAAGRPPAMSG